MRPGRSIAVHRAAKDAALVPMLLYGPEGIYRSRLFLSQMEESETEGRASRGEKKGLGSLDLFVEKKLMYGIMDLMSFMKYR